LKIPWFRAKFKDCKTIGKRINKLKNIQKPSAKKKSEKVTSPTENQSYSKLSFKLSSPDPKSLEKYENFVLGYKEEGEKNSIEKSTSVHVDCCIGETIFKKIEIEGISIEEKFCYEFLLSNPNFTATKLTEFGIKAFSSTLDFLLDCSSQLQLEKKKKKLAKEKSASNEDEEGEGEEDKEIELSAVVEISNSDIVDDAINRLDDGLRNFEFNFGPPMVKKNSKLLLDKEFSSFFKWGLTMLTKDSFFGKIAKSKQILAQTKLQKFNQVSDEVLNSIRKGVQREKLLSKKFQLDSETPKATFNIDPKKNLTDSEGYIPKDSLTLIASSGTGFIFFKFFFLKFFLVSFQRKSLQHHSKWAKSIFGVNNKIYEKKIQFSGFVFAKKQFTFKKIYDFLWPKRANLSGFELPDGWELDGSPANLKEWNSHLSHASENCESI
jgi:hypothetical protein